ncbi:MAG: hypothetical protein HZB51_32610 [Chloroflexi bacterium]|nr:hypothetical protein [Chloroflexota bacterium]
MERYQHSLNKIEIEPSAFKDIRRQLDRVGYNAASLYADLDGLARHIEWLYSKLEDERK